MTGNVVFSVILTRRELRNAFNLLLVCLAFFDTCYVVGAILESIRYESRIASHSYEKGTHESPIRVALHTYLALIHFMYLQWNLHCECHS